MNLTGIYAGNAIKYKNNETNLCNNYNFSFHVVKTSGEV